MYIFKCVFVYFLMLGYKGYEYIQKLVTFVLFHKQHTCTAENLKDGENYSEK